jgi:hypothetical protein
LLFAFWNGARLIREILLIQTVHGWNPFFLSHSEYGYGYGYMMANQIPNQIVSGQSEHNSGQFAPDCPLRQSYWSNYFRWIARLFRNVLDWLISSHWP